MLRVPADSQIISKMDQPPTSSRTSRATYPYELGKAIFYQRADSVHGCFRFWKGYINDLMVLDMTEFGRCFRVSN